MARRMFPVNEWNKIKSDIEHLQGVKVTNITQLSDEVLDSLKVGDLVIKKTGNLGHQYRVSYKEEKHGICLSYYAAGYLETVSYDYNGTTKHWVYNSTDIYNIDEVIDGKIETAITGAINDTY